MRKIFTFLILLPLLTLNIITAKRDKKKFQWVSASNGQIPSNAIKAGSNQGKNLYFARALLNKGLHIGYIQDGEHKAHITSDQVVHSLPFYQVLVGSMNRVKWVTGHPQYLPQNSIKGGYEANGEPLFIGKAKNSLNQFPGQFRVEWTGVKYPLNKVQITGTNFEILVFLSNRYYRDYMVDDDSDLKSYMNEQLLKAKDDIQENDHKIKTLTLVAIVLSIIIAFLVIAVILLSCKIRRKNRRGEQTIRVSYDQKNIGLGQKGLDADIYS